jgi:hypothetical protein
LWGGIGGGFKFHLVSWSKICTLMSFEGLAVRKLVQFKRALLEKWLWRYDTERGTLWKSVMETIYDSMSGGWFSKEIVGPFGVGVWKYVRREWGVFSRFVRYEVGDGSTIKFSHDL